MAERLTLPVLPLREVVLFPGVTAPIGRPRCERLRLRWQDLTVWSLLCLSARTSKA
jgi:hypothetical protein